MEKKECKYCGEGFERWRSKKRMFCSRDCANSWKVGKTRSKKVTSKCAVCGNKFEHYEKIVRRYCSRECFGMGHKEWMLTNNPFRGMSHSEETKRKMMEAKGNFTGERSFNDYTEDWCRVRVDVYRRSGFMCSVCCRKRCRLSAHHIDYNKKNNDPDNLIALCDSCHSKTNTRREYWKNYFMEDYKNVKPV